MEVKPKRFRKFLKRLNRGVFIGIVIVLILVSYTAIDNLIFEVAHRENIETMVREYALDMIKLNDTATENTVGDPLTSDGRAEMRTALEAFVEKYYTNSKDAVIMYGTETIYGNNNLNGVELIEKFDQNADGIRGLVIENAKIISAEELEDPYGYVYEDIILTRMAGKYVHVYMQVNYEVTCLTSDPDNLSFFGLGTNGYMKEYGYDDGKYDGEGEEDKADLYRVKARISVSGTVKIVRVHGEWRIACTDGIYSYVTNYTKSPIKNEEVNING